MIAEFNNQWEDGAAVTKQLIAARCNVDPQVETLQRATMKRAANGHQSVTKQLIVARCKVDVQDKNAFTWSHPSSSQDRRWSERR